MASVSVLEEGSKTLKSFDSERIKRLYDKIYEDVFNSRASFLTDDDHLELLSGKKGISICRNVEWCKPEVTRDFTPLR